MHEELACACPGWQDPAKLESCILFMYTAHPLAPHEIKGVSISELKWWLDLPGNVAKALHDQVESIAESALTMDTIPSILRAAFTTSRAGGSTPRESSSSEKQVKEVMRRFASTASCQAYLHEAMQMVDVLTPFRPLDR